jgi:DNA helicase IV
MIVQERYIKSERSLKMARLAKAIFAHKPSNTNDLNKAIADGNKASYYQVEKEIVLTREQYDDFCKNLFKDQAFIIENKSLMKMAQGIYHCILVKRQGGSSAILVEAEGYDYPRYAAFIEA